MKTIKILLIICAVTAIFSIELSAQDHQHMNMNHSKMGMKKKHCKN